MEKLEKHFEIFFPVFIEENCKVNLVSFSNKKEFFYKHFYDSAQLLDFMDIQPFEKVLDVGTGGGFPGLVLAMLRPHASFVLVDSVRKKINCIKRILTSIGIDNVELVCERAELLGHNHTFRGQFSIVVSRAVASLNALSEYCVPFLSVGGKFVSYKSRSYQTELTEAKHAINILGGKIHSIHDYDLPLGYGQRSLIVIEKRRKTPELYPRGIGIPKKRPLTL